MQENQVPGTTKQALQPQGIQPFTASLGYLEKYSERLNKIDFNIYLVNILISINISLNSSVYFFSFLFSLTGDKNSNKTAPFSPACITESGDSSSLFLLSYR